MNTYTETTIKGKVQYKTSDEDVTQQEANKKPEASKTSTSEFPSMPQDCDHYIDFSIIKPSRSQSQNVCTFPSKLHLILSTSSFRNYIMWLPHGRSWRIIEPQMFEDEVIPLVFRQTSLSSFIRQVHGWGFRRVKDGPDQDSLYHECFLRGLPHLCRHIRRLGKDELHFLNSLPSRSPDFYAMSKNRPLPEINVSSSIPYECHDSSETAKVDPTANQARIGAIEEELFLRRQFHNSLGYYSHFQTNVSDD